MAILECALRRTVERASDATIDRAGRRLFLTAQNMALRPERRSIAPGLGRRFGRGRRPRLDLLAGPPRRPSHQPPQGRKAARVRELWRVRGSPLSSARSGPPLAGSLRRRCRMLAAVASGRGARSLPQIPARDLRRGRRAGARHRAAAHRAGGRSDQPRLPVLRPARLRQDVIGADPGPLAELRAGADPGPVRRVRIVHRAGAGRARARSTSSSWTRPATAASTTPGICATRRSTCRPSPATGCSSSTRRTWSRRRASTPC